MPLAAIRSGAARNISILEPILRDNLKQQGNGNYDEATAQPAKTRCSGRNPLLTKQQEQEHVAKLGYLFYEVTPST
ncbi:hypothetical protein JTB14_036610 [Gonioctena quinquepunctata]|nr:hypothetical protein JTB14_036610 [Gonioctena quinquepunctata]